MSPNESFTLNLDREVRSNVWSGVPGVWDFVTTRSQRGRYFTPRPSIPEVRRTTSSTTGRIVWKVPRVAGVVFRVEGKTRPESGLDVGVTG